MKMNKIYYCIFLITISILMIACSSDDDNTTPPIENGPLVKTMSYNIKSGDMKGMDAIGKVIKAIDPDIVGLQEVTYTVNGVDVVERLKEITGMQYAFFAEALQNNGIPYGNLILSKTPFTHTESHKLDYLIEAYIRSIGIVKTKVNGEEFYFATTHIDHSQAINRIYHVEQILGYTSALEGPTILCGDFNGDEVSEPVTMLKKQFTIGCLYDYCPPTMTVPQPDGAIDFILFSNDDFVSKQYNSYYKAYTESDHFPVYATFMFKK